LVQFGDLSRQAKEPAGQNGEEEMTMSQLPAERNMPVKTGAPPPEWKPDMGETADKRMPDRDRDMQHSLPIEDDEMPA
jgi:hypothetical protein